MQLQRLTLAARLQRASLYTMLSSSSSSACVHNTVETAPTGNCFAATKPELATGYTAWQQQGVKPSLSSIAFI